MKEELSDSIASALQEIPRGYLPLKIFFEVARILVTPIIEIVPLHIKNGQVYTLLTARPIEDPFWGGMEHTPGTILLSTDKPGDFSDAFKRIKEKELENPTVVGEPTFVTTYFHDSNRGRELSQIFWWEVTDDVPKAGKFYPINNLPKNLVESQKAFIGDAIKHFKILKNLD